MDLKFNFEEIQTVEFGIGKENKIREYFSVPTNKMVKDALKEMAKLTWNAMQNTGTPGRLYEPSEKHERTEYLYVPLSNSLVHEFKMLYQADYLQHNSIVLNDIQNIFCYFSKMTDKSGEKITAIRRAGTFKGIVKNSNRLMQLIDDSLTIVKSPVFKLDNEFDVIIDKENIHILRPSGFEFMGKMQDAILAAVPDNVPKIQSDMPFVEFSNIGAYAEKHPRAARYLASICENSKNSSIDKQLFKDHCDRIGIKVTLNHEDKIVIESGQEMSFLEALDRRRYQLNLVKDMPENYIANSRKIVQ